MGKRIWCFWQLRPLKAVCNVPNLVPECSEIVLIPSDLGFVASNLLSGKGPLHYKYHFVQNKTAAGKTHEELGCVNVCL